MKTGRFNFYPSPYEDLFLFVALGLAISTIGMVIIEVVLW